MTVQELRIGNKVQDANGFIFYVVSIHDDGTIYCDFDGNEGDVWEFDDNNPCYGIELTGEILAEWCGFKEIQKGVFQLKDWYIDLYSKTWKFKREYIDINFNYLHEIQNLWSALTGEELEINL